jgi:hypothetical protein
MPISRRPRSNSRAEGWGELAAWKKSDPGFAEWIGRNVAPHRHPDYAMVTISLKPIGGIPGDASADQMDAVARLAEEFAHDEIRVTHEQNLVLPHVALADLEPLYRALLTDGLATANAGLITDIIACPGLDYCALANARSIPVAQEISNRFGDPKRQAEIGDLKIKISGCINACGHHHVGHIGILGVEKKGRNSTRSRLAARATKMPPSARSPDAASSPARSPMRSRPSSTPISPTAPRPTRPLSTAIAALAPILSRPRFTTAKPKPPEPGVENRHDCHLDTERDRRERPLGIGGGRRGRPRLLPLAEALDTRRTMRRSAWCCSPPTMCASLAPILERVAIVALTFPAFSDGRGFSQAMLLRERLGYKGENCAPSATVLLDQVPLMLGPALTASRSTMPQPSNGWSKGGCRASTCITSLRPTGPTPRPVTAGAAPPS